MEDIVHISDVIEKYISGDWGEEANTNENLIKVFCIRGADINNVNGGIFNHIPFRYIEPQSLCKKCLKEGNIIIEKSGGAPTQSTGRVAYISKECIKAHKHIVCSNFCVAFSIKSEWDAHYIFYYLQYIYSLGIFFNFEGKTSGIRNLQVEQAFANIPIRKISLPTQRKVAELLSALDQKIALNRTINQQLEQLARTIYNYYFLQFHTPLTPLHDTPSRPQHPNTPTLTYNPILKKNIPIGWHCGNLLEIANFTNGLACQNHRPAQGEKGLPVIKIKEMHEGFSDDTEFVSENISESVKVHNGDILFSWSASLEVMIWAKGEGGLNQHIFKVTPKEGYSKIYCYFQLLYYVDIFKKIADARKTTMGHITQDHLQQSTIAIPDDLSIVKDFENRVKPIFDLIINNQTEIASLTTYRDALLPLLMNGQVEVKV